MDYSALKLQYKLTNDTQFGETMIKLNKSDPNWVRTMINTLDLHKHIK